MIKIGIEYDINQKYTIKQGKIAYYKKDQLIIQHYDSYKTIFAYYHCYKNKIISET